MFRKLAALLAVLALPLVLGACASNAATEGAAEKQAHAICGGSNGVAAIELSSPGVKAKCDTPEHARQAEREKHEEGEAALSLEREPEVLAAKQHKEAEAQANSELGGSE